MLTGLIGLKIKQDYTGKNRIYSGYSLAEIYTHTVHTCYGLEYERIAYLFKKYNLYEIFRKTNSLLQSYGVGGIVEFFDKEWFEPEDRVGNPVVDGCIMTYRRGILEEDRDLVLIKILTVDTMVQTIVNKLAKDKHIGKSEAYATLIQTKTYLYLIGLRTSLCMTYWEYVYAELQKELSGDCEHLFENTTFDFFNIEQLQNTNDILDDILN